MPIYPYSCQNCQHAFEALQKISDKPLTQCPNCSEEKLVKMLSAPSFQLSGSGWFRDEKTKPTTKAITEATPTAASGN